MILKKTKDLLDVNNTWINYDVVIYTPTIEAGVSFDVKNHFNKIYGVLSSGSTSQRAFYEMLSRVRHITDNNVLLLHSNLNLNNVNNYWTYEEVKQGLVAIKSSELNYVYEQKGDNIVKSLALNLYDTNLIYNRVEELNKNPCYFLSYFKEFGEQKNYQFSSKMKEVISKKQSQRMN